MDPQPPQQQATSIEPSDETVFADALAAVSTEQWKDLWVALDAIAADAPTATWGGGDAVDTTIVDGVERPVVQMPYPVYSEPMALPAQTECLSASHPGVRHQ